MTDFIFHTPETTTGDAKEILTNVKQKYGFVPNLFAYMAEAPYTIEAYAFLNDLLSKTGLTPAQQQTALLAVSVYNQCEFCRVAHQAFAKGAKANPQTVQAITEGSTIEDTKDKALVDMIVSMVDSRGWVGDERIASFLDAGFSKRNIYDLILVITIKTLSNYSNHLTKPEPNEQLLGMI